MTKIKSPRSFRMDGPTADQFSLFAKEKGITQDEAMCELLEFYRLVEAKKLDPSRAKEIENFIDHIRVLIYEYVRSLEIERHTEEKLRQEFINCIQSKDETIAKLQENVHKLSDSLDLVNKKLEEAEYQTRKTMDNLQNAYRHAEFAENAVKDKERAIEMLQKKLADTDIKSNENVELKQKILELKSDNNKLVEELSRNKKEADYEKEKIVNSKKFEISKEIVSLQVELSAAVASAAEKDRQLERVEKRNTELENLIIDLKTHIATVTENKKEK